jgi:hypothetical protein
MARGAAQHYHFDTAGEPRGRAPEPQWCLPVTRNGKKKAMVIEILRLHQVFGILGTFAVHPAHWVVQVARSYLRTSMH